MFICFFFISMMVVVFRMKKVEFFNQYSDLNHKIQRQEKKNKNLEAVYERLISPANLQKLAKKHGLRKPQEKNIIVIR